jgi:drug/metabolite transporter (DMT)-like permease
MNPAVIVALLGLTAAISWGISDFFSARSAKTIGAGLAACLVNAIGSLLFVIIYLLFMHPHVAMSATAFDYAAVSGITVSVGAAAFFVGLEVGPVSIVSPLTSTYPLITTLLALVAFHAHLTIEEIGGILLTVLGITAASGLLATRKSERKLSKGPTYALVAALTWGVGFALLAQAIKRINWELASVIELSFCTLTLFALLPLTKGTEEISWRATWQGLKSKFVLTAGVIQLGGVIGLNLGIARSTSTDGAVVTAISACYPILTIFLALKHFGEKVDLLPLAGAFVGIAGIVILSL